MPVKHSTIPAGTDQPGFTGVTPSIWAQQHTFSGGTQGAVLTYNTGSSDNSSWVNTVAGFLLASGTNVLPTFTATVPFATTFTFFGDQAFTAGGVGRNSLTIQNSTAGTGNYAALFLDNDAGLKRASLRFFSSTYTTGTWDAQNALALQCAEVGGISIAATSVSGAIRFYTGGTANTMSLSSGGLLTVSGFGTHVFSASGTGQQRIALRNNTAGTGNFSSMQLGIDTADIGLWQAYSSTYTSGTFDQALGTALRSTNSGGLSITAEHASGTIRFYSQGTFNTGTISNGRFDLVASASDYILTLASSGGSGRTWALKSKTTGTFSFDNDLTAGLMTLSSSGVLTVSGAGQHVFSAGTNGLNSLRVENTTSGTAALGEVQIRNNITNQLAMRVYSGGFTTSGALAADTAVVLSDTGGGINFVSASGSGSLNWYVGGTASGNKYMSLSNAGLLTVSGFGTHMFSAGGNGDQQLQLINTTSSTTAFARFNVGAGTANGYIETFSQGYSGSSFQLAGDTDLWSNSGNLHIATNSAKSLLLWTNATLRWGINAAGDFTFGASSHIAMSSGSPSFSSGFGGAPTVSGTDYSFFISSSGANTTGVINFGHTWSSTPNCVVTPFDPNGATCSAGLHVTTNTTTQLGLAWTTSAQCSFAVHCLAS